MEKIGRTTEKYWKQLTERVKKSKVYQPYQFTGLTIADLLEDNKNKSLYIKLAKENDNDQLIRLAKKIAENKNIRKKGAYFMKIFFEEKKLKDKPKN